VCAGVRFDHGIVNAISESAKAAEAAVRYSERVRLRHAEFGPEGID
jgi:predicted ATPase